MKALLASYYPVQNPSTGGQRRVAELVRALAPDVFLVQPEPAHPEVPGVGFPRDWGRHKIGINWGMFNLYLPGNRRVARRAAVAAHPDVAVADSIWCHDAFRGLGFPRVLDAQNVDAAAVGERFGTGHPFTRWVRAVERRVTAEAAHIFCCSQSDAELFGRMYGLPDAKLSVAPNGVRVASGAPPQDPAAEAARRDAAEKTALYFMGKLDYGPNVEALRFLAREVLPILERRAPGRFVCWVSGGPNLPPGVEHSALRYVGRVPAVEPWLAAADICVAPVFSGGGTRLKVLEFLAAGKPLVGTAKAVEGLGLTDGVEARIAEREAFADAVFGLAADVAAGREMAQRGAARVRRDYSWEATARVWREGLERVIRASRG